MSCWRLIYKGAANLRASEVDAVYVFVVPPSWEVLVARLQERGSESEVVRAAPGLQLPEKNCVTILVTIIWSTMTSWQMRRIFYRRSSELSATGLPVSIWRRLRTPHNAMRLIRLHWAQHRTNGVGRRRIMLQNKTVLLGVGSGPLTWSAVEVLRALQRAGAQVQVVLSRDTEAFIPALTFQTLAGATAIPAEELYGTAIGGEIRSLAARMAAVDVMVIVPATPALLAKAAIADADEALIRAMLLHAGPTLMAYPGLARPYQHVLVQHNLQRLRDAGMILVDDAVQETDAAVDELGWVLSAQTVVDAVEVALAPVSDFAGKVAIITAGPTQEPIDPVRHISNRSSGKTGFALAAAVHRRGAKVILVSGPTNLPARLG